MPRKVFQYFAVFFFVAVSIVHVQVCFGTGRAVSDIRLKGLVNIQEQTVRDVIPFKVGDEFHIEELDRAIGYLRKWNVFDTIEARTFDAPEGVVVEIVFSEAIVVTRVDVAGNYPYLENKILKYLTLSTGDLYTPKRVEEQIERIKEFYKREGFVDTEIFVEEESEPLENGVALTFHIKRGEIIRYRKIEVQGNHAYPAGRFTSKIDSWRHYSELGLRRALRELTEFYRLHGYPRAKISIVKKTIDFDKGHADLVISVNEGPHVKAQFKGNKHLSNSRLRKTVTIFKEGAYDSFEIEASAQAITDLYKEIGYPEASVETAAVTKKDGSVLIKFKIKEGQSKIVKDINFEGNNNVGAHRLKKAMATKQRAFGHKGAFNPEFEADDSKAIKEVLGSDGYKDAQVGTWDVKTTKQGFDLAVTIPIVEGYQTKVQKVEFHGSEAFSKKRLLSLLKVRPKKPFNQIEFPQDRLRLLTFYADHGYPYAEVKQQVEYNDERHTANIIYEIVEGSFVKIGKILITGDVLTSQKAIKGAMSIKEGAPFSFKKIADSELNLRKLGAFNTVKVETIGLAEKESTVHLLVDVDEQKPFRLDLEFGYSTDYSFTGALAFTNLNSFGWAKHTNLKLTGGRDLARAELGWLDPAFVGSSVEMSVLGWIQHEIRPAFDYIQTAGNMGFFRRYRSFGFFFKYELDRNYCIEGDSTAADAESLRNNTISKISLSSSYDTRDSFANPLKGWYTLGGVDIFNEIRGNNANFFKFNWQGENEATAWKRFTLSTALRFNRIQTLGKNVSVPTNELLFLGGDDTIRGFGEDSLGPVNAKGKATGSRTRWIWNEEVRILLFNHFSWAFFYDMGSLTYNFTDINWDTIRKSAGFGIRYVTPVGPLRADYGIKLDRKTGESFGRFHLTFGYVF